MLCASTFVDSGKKLKGSYLNGSSSFFIQIVAPALRNAMTFPMELDSRTKAEGIEAVLTFTCYHSRSNEIF